MAEHDIPFYESVEFWVFVAFVIFVLAVGRKVGAVVGGIIDNRATTIRNQIEEARALREEAQTRLAEIRKQQRDAAREAEEIVAHARREAERHRIAAAAALESTLARRREQALEKIAQAEADAIREVRRQAGDIAIAAARKVIAEDLAGPNGDALIDRSVAELPRRFH